MVILKEPIFSNTPAVFLFVKFRTLLKISPISSLSYELPYAIFSKV